MKLKTVVCDITAIAYGYGLNFCELKTKKMKNRIELTIEHKDHNTVELTNCKGDTFTYDPQKHEGFEDFLSGAKILPIADVVGTLCNHNWHHLDNHSDRMMCVKCDKRI